MKLKNSPLLRARRASRATLPRRRNNQFLALILAACVLEVCLAASAQKTPSQAPVVSAEARRIHNSAIIVDTHADTPQRFVDEGFDLATVTPVSNGHVDLKKVREGNLGAEFFAAWVEPDQFPGHFAKRAMGLIDSVHEQVRRHPGEMVMAYSADDIVRARTGPHKKLATLLGLEGGHAIENKIELLRDYYGRGVRYMTLTWSNTNEWADSSGDINQPNVAHHDGLTPFGKQVVWEMNRLGMMVDVSHVADKTFWDTIAVSKAPVIASHSSARALDGAPRNMSDEMLKAMATNGGVVMVNFYSGFISDSFRKAYSAQAPEREAAMKAFEAKLKAEGKPTTYAMVNAVSKEWTAKIPRPAFKELIDHIDHIAQVAGVEHVGLGADWDGVDSLPQGIDSVADLPKITQALLNRGYGEAQIKGILGGNLLRVFRRVEQVSRELQSQQKSAAASE